MKTALMILGALLMASTACTAAGNATMKTAGSPLIQAHRGSRGASYTMICLNAKYESMAVKAVFDFVS